MRIGIIGCGWLGLPLGRALVARGHEVVGTTTTPDKLVKLAAAGIEGYLLDLNTAIPDDTRAALSGCQRLFVNIPPGRGYADIVTRYPDWMWRLSRLNNARMDRWLLAGTTGVYGAVKGKVTEETPAQPVRASGKAVRAAERVLSEELGEKLVVARLAGLVGGRREAGRFLAGKQEVPNGDAPVNLVHRADVIALVIRLLEAETLAHDCYHICADAHPEKKVLYPERARRLGLQAPTFLNGGEAEKWIDNARIKAAFDYAFRYPNPLEFPYEGT